MSHLVLGRRLEIKQAAVAPITTKVKQATTVAVAPTEQPIEESAAVITTSVDLWHFRCFRHVGHIKTPTIGKASTQTCAHAGHAAK